MSTVAEETKGTLVAPLPDNVQDFGPPSAYSTERFAHKIAAVRYAYHFTNTLFCRCEFFNGMIRAQNIYSNSAQAETLPIVSLYLVIFNT